MSLDVKNRITQMAALTAVVGWLLGYNGCRFSGVDRDLEALGRRVATIETKVGVVPVVPPRPALIASPVEQILVTRCQRCHLPTSQAVQAGFAPPLFDREGAVVEPDKSMRVRIYEVARNGIMPPRKDLDGSTLDPLTDDEFLAIKGWLFPGAN